MNPRWWIGRTLQVAGLASAGFGAIGAFWTDMTEAQFIGFGFGGFAVFWVGCRILGVGQT